MMSTAIMHQSALYDFGDLFLKVCWFYLTFLLLFTVIHKILVLHTNFGVAVTLYRLSILSYFYSLIDFTWRPHRFA